MSDFWMPGIFIGAALLPWLVVGYQVMRWRHREAWYEAHDAEQERAIGLMLQKIDEQKRALRAQATASAN